VRSYVEYQYLFICANTYCKTTVLCHFDTVDVSLMSF
jgi:hypothetical protein